MFLAYILIVVYTSDNRTVCSIVPINKRDGSRQAFHISQSHDASGNRPSEHRPVHFECMSGTELSSNGSRDQPVGQITSCFPKWPVQPPLQKYFPSRLTQIKSIILAVSSHMRGVSRSSRTRGGMRWTRAAPKTRALTCGRRSRVVLTPRRRRQVLREDARDDGHKQARSPGRARNKP